MRLALLLAITAFLAGAFSQSAAAGEIRLKKQTAPRPVMKPKAEPQKMEPVKTPVALPCPPKITRMQPPSDACHYVEDTVITVHGKCFGEKGGTYVLAVSPPIPPHVLQTQSWSKTQIRFTLPAIPELTPEGWTYAHVGIIDKVEVSGYTSHGDFASVVNGVSICDADQAAAPDAPTGLRAGDAPGAKPAQPATPSRRRSLLRRSAESPGKGFSRPESKAPSKSAQEPDDSIADNEAVAGFNESAFGRKAAGIGKVTAARGNLEVQVNPTVTNCFGLSTTMIGTPSSETINGTPGDDVINAGAGNDIVYGHGGNDVICGADGNDKLYGGSGEDRLGGGFGDDELYGGAHNDVLQGHGNNDKLYGENGDDMLYGYYGNNVLNGGAGNDKCKDAPIGGGSNSTVNCEQVMH